MLIALKGRNKKFNWFPEQCILAAFYQPHHQSETKTCHLPRRVSNARVAVGIITHEGAEPELQRWYSDDANLLNDLETGLEIRAFLKNHGVLSVSMVDRIIGCPHEEGIDYPDGSFCPECPFWRGRDRFTGETIN